MGLGAVGTRRHDGLEARARRAQAAHLGVELQPELGLRGRVPQARPHRGEGGGGDGGGRLDAGDLALVLGHPEVVDEALGGDQPDAELVGQAALLGPRDVVRLERDRLERGDRSHQRRGLGRDREADGDVDDVAEAGGGELVGGLGLVPAVGDQQDPVGGHQHHAGGAGEAGEPPDVDQLGDQQRRRDPVERLPDPLDPPGHVHGRERRGEQAGHGTSSLQGEGGEAVAVAGEAADDPLGHRGDDRGAAPRVAGARVGQVQLDDDAVEGGEGVVDGPGVVGEGAGVDDDAGVAPPAVADGVDQLALVVRLEVADLPAVAERLAERGDVVVEGGRAVDLGLADAEEVEVRSRQEQGGSGHGSRSSRVAWASASSTPATTSTPAGPSRAKVRPSSAFLSRPMRATSSAASDPGGGLVGRS